jgi:EpsI family protein
MEFGKMGKSVSKRWLILSVALLLTCAVIYWSSESTAAQKAQPLRQALGAIDGWRAGKPLDLGDEVVEALMLDDHLYRNYHKGGQVVSLYIGYYLTTQKVGAAHSPLVCFPGQGWMLSNAQSMTVATSSGDIQLEKMIAAKGGHRELLLYWFQSYDRSSSGTLRQKVNNFLSRFQNNREDNAFVRITVPLSDMSETDALEAGIDFIKAFYPAFLAYVKSDIAS